jgi:ABC-type branched-subunit amino acid transport system ATPase component
MDWGDNAMFVSETVMFHCEGLTLSFGGVQALSNVSLRFAPREISAIIGPNGAGKTTLINVLSGFLRPDTGRCFLGNIETTYLAPHLVARLGLARTFQDLRLIFNTSALENVLLARPHQKGEMLLRALLRYSMRTDESRNTQAALSLLKFVGLEDSALELAGELSYGQQKLLTVACCFATEARVLLLDEPVAGVHPEMASRILSLLQELRNSGRLVVLVEHDIDAVRQIADSVIAMDEGKVVAVGTPKDVLEDPRIVEAYLG